MGAMQNNERVPKNRKKSRGSTDNAGRLAAFANGASTGEASWGGCDPKWVQAVIVAITDLGGAVTFGLSRDGGAHSMTLLLDEGRKSLWFNGDADLDDELKLVLGTLETL